MPEPDAAYCAFGERIDPDARQTIVDYYMAMRADGISIVATAERALRDLGQPVEAAVRTREERRSGRHLTDRNN